MTAMRAAWLRLTIAVAAIAGAAGCNAGPIDIAILSPTSLAAGLVGHWTFDEGEGMQVRDTSGNERNGTVLGVGWSWIDAGKFRGAFQFAGGDQVAVGGGFGFPQATRDYTVSAWVRVGATDTQPPIAAILSNEVPWGVGPPGGFSLNVDFPAPGSVGEVANYHFEYWIGDSVTSMDMAHVQCDCVAPDVWTHLAAVVNQTTMTLTLYVNGAARQEVSVPRSIGIGERTLYMGRWPQTPTRALIGALDDVAIYSRALVPEEVVQLYRAQAPDPV
jgi:hypothetical protein